MTCLVDCSGQGMQSEGRDIVYHREVRIEEFTAREGQENGKRDGKMECEKVPSHYLAHGLGKLKRKVQNAGGSALRRRSLYLGCDGTAAALAKGKILHTETTRHFHSTKLQ